MGLREDEVSFSLLDHPYIILPNVVCTSKLMYSDSRPCFPYSFVLPWFVIPISDENIRLSKWQKPVVVDHCHSHHVHVVLYLFLFDLS